MYRSSFFVRWLAYLWVGSLVACVASGQSPSSSRNNNSGAPTQRVNGEVATNSDMTERQKIAAIKYELANNYLRAGQLNTALDEVKIALQIDPTLAPAQHLKAIIYAQMGQTDLAIRDYAKAVQMNPNDPDILNNYGWLLCNQGQYTKAMPLFESAMRSPQNNTAKPYTNAGLCSLFAKQVPQAANYFQKAIKLDPTNTIANIHMARILMVSGNEQAAQAYLSQLNNSPALTSESLWLEAKIARKTNQTSRFKDLVNELGRSFPNSKEYTAYERGAWHE